MDALLEIIEKVSSIILISSRIVNIFIYYGIYLITFEVYNFSLKTIFLSVMLENHAI